MALHNDIGNYGEELACEHLKAKGFKILETNWKFSRAEVDIIAWDKKVLVFVEVKTRTSTSFGRPEAFVTKKKMKLLTQAASFYSEKINHDWEVRFDVVSVVDRKNKQPVVEHIEDAFFLGLK